MTDTLNKTASASAGLSRRRLWADKARVSCILGGLIVVGMAAVAAYLGPKLLQRLRPAEPAASESSPAAFSANLVPEHPDELLISDKVAAATPVQVTAAQVATEATELRFSGTLTLDPNRYATVRSRFAGEVVELPAGSTTETPVVTGDTVEKDELLAVLWSRELGEKKSELVDALSQMALNQGTYDRLLELYKKGDLPERSLRDAQRAVQADKIVVDRITRTLQSWRESEETIQALHEEVKRHSTAAPHSDDELVHQWARVEVRAPLTGVVLERNITTGEMVQTTDELFKIADLSRLRVVAYAYEEDLPRLDALPADQRRWRVTVPAEPEAEPQDGAIDRIGQIVDPAQHTALVMGWVPNPAGRLRVGQFVTATVRLACPRDEVVIPAAALLETGVEKFVFVQPTAGKHEYQLQRIHLARRLGATITVKSQSPTEPGTSALVAGELVVSSGAVEMLGALRDLQAAKK